MSEDVQSQVIWATTLIIVIGAISLAGFSSCSSNNEKHKVIGEACASAGGTWIPSQGGSYQCLGAGINAKEQESGK